MATSHTNSRPVKTAETAFEIIETIRSQDGATLTELAEELDLANSTVHRHLQTLVERGYLVKEGHMYFPSLRFLDIGEYVRSRKSAYSLAETKVEELSDATDERAQFMILEQGSAVYMYKSAGKNAVEINSHIGKRVPMNASAAGLAILAHTPREEVDRLLTENELPSLTEHTLTDKEKIIEELSAIRDRGYSINDQGFICGLRALGAPVLDADDEVIGALSVSGPINRMRGEWFEEELPNLLLGSVNELELKIAY